MIIREAYAQGSADLKFAGIDTPGLDASLLLAHVLKTTRTALVAAGTEKLSEKICKEYCSLIERRCLGECVAYLTGKKEFRGLEFHVNHSVLVPRPETETLVEAAIEIVKSNGENQKDDKQKPLCDSKLSAGQQYSGVNILELCTGSGAVAISLKNELPELEIHATDISKEALEIARKNAKRLLPGSNLHFYQGDLYSALSNCSLLIASNRRFAFSLIIANPPYIPSDEIQTLSQEVQNEPRLALDGGKSGLDIITRIIAEAPDYLSLGGTLLLEADPRQMLDIAELFKNRGFINIRFFEDLSGKKRVIGGIFE